MDLLKACPRCGGNTIELHRTNTRHYYYVCVSCWYRSVVPTNNKKLAARIWNDRTRGSFTDSR